MDKHEQIAFDSQILAVILGNPNTQDFELVDPAAVPLPDETAAALHARGLGFIGTIGVADGQFRSAFEVPVDPATATALARSFISFVVAKLTPSPCADGVDWLRRLYNLPDNRKEMN